MKLKLIIISLFISVLSFGQTNNDRQVPFHVADSITLFNASLIDGTIVFDESNNKLWRLDARATGGLSLSTISKTLIIDPSSSGGGVTPNLSQVLTEGNTANQSIEMLLNPLKYTIDNSIFLETNPSGTESLSLLFPELTDVRGQSFQDQSGVIALVGDVENLASKLQQDSISFQDSINLNSNHRYTVTGNPHQIDISDIPNLSDSLSNSYDGNGIYGGNGTVPLNTSVSLDNKITFGSNLLILDDFLGRLGFGTNTLNESFNFQALSNSLGFNYRGAGGNLIFDMSGNSTANNTATFVLGGDNSFDVTAGAVFRQSSSSPHPFRVEGISAEQRFIVNNIGNVAVGTFTPLAKLHIQASGVGIGQSFLIKDAVGTDNFTVLDNGRVGIGNSTPQSRLELLSAVGETSLILSTLGTGGSNRIYEYYSNGSTLQQRQFTNGSFQAGGDLNNPLLSSIRYAAPGTFRVSNTNSGNIFEAFNTVSSKVVFRVDRRGDIFAGDNTITASTYFNFGSSTGLTVGGAINSAQSILTLLDQNNNVKVKVLNSGNMTVDGDIETLGTTDGYIVNDRSNGNRYRIYVDGGNLFVELVP